MLRRERLLLYPLILLLALFVVADRVGHQEPLLSKAQANGSPDDTPPRLPAPDPETSAASTSDPMASRLLAIQENHLVWGDGPRQRTYTVGFVDLAPLMAPLMETAPREQARAALREELTREEARLREYIEHLADQASRYEPQSQEYSTIYNEYVQLAEAYENFEQDAMTRTGRLDAEQLEEVYRLVLAAVNEVAEREGIDLVHRRTDPAAAFEAEGPQAAMTAIRLRDTLRIPDGLDITALVRTELGMP